MIDYPEEDFPAFAELTEALSPSGNRVGVLTLTNHDERRPTTLGPLGLARLGEALDEFSSKSGGFAALIVTGNGRTFCAGANLDTLANPRHFGDALQLAQEGHRVLSKLSTLGIPTIAAINGTALGGGLELALHCSHRVAQEGPIALGLPEIGLGLVPGWGGATLLPQLIGFESALRVMVDNAIAGKTLMPHDALKLGIVDSVAHNALDGALALVDSQLTLDRKNQTITSPYASERIDATIDRYVGRTSNPIDALAHLRRVLHHSLVSTQNESFEAEDAALADLMTSSEFRRRLYAFRVTGSAHKAPRGTPSVPTREINTVGVVGAGLMASQIALAFAESRDGRVIITDVTHDKLDAAHDRISAWLNARVVKGALTSDTQSEILSRITTTLSIDDFADCDLVIEAVFEDLSVKKDVLTALDAVVPAECIIASNTSSLSIETMASYVSHPDRIAGIHFFNPVASMKLVEVARNGGQSDETLSTAISIAQSLGKTPVIVADQPGFVVNRLLSTFLGESLRLLESGVSESEISAALEPLRLPMTPFALIDLIGRSVSLSMLESLQASAPARFFVGDTMRAVTATPSSNSVGDDLAALIQETRVLARSEIHNIVVDALAREVRVMLDANVVTNATDIDLCMINGAGWPAASGGMTPYLDACGASERAAGWLFHPTSDFA
jgi:3-hydroxyacyl-CoA dehydrogenase/enoyl-CoA hydratase/carnithine racemase